jgi:hypothetical protein
MALNAEQGGNLFQEFRTFVEGAVVNNGYRLVLNFGGLPVQSLGNGLEIRIRIQL